MRLAILGGGPAGLYSGLVIKKAQPTHDITIFERNPADVTYGWGVVFSDRTLASFQRADYSSYERIAERFVIWDAIDICYRGEKIRCGGHIISGISRKTLLNILQGRCRELGVTLHFDQEIIAPEKLTGYDLVIAADGVNSVARRTFAEQFQPSITLGKAKYIWLGAEKVLDAFTFIFQQNEHGLFQVHAYPFSGTTSTFLIECDDATWRNAGLDLASETESLDYCQRLLTPYLDGARLLSNNSRWISFSTLKTKHWRYRNMVLLGDAAHTAHFSIGSGTKLAMEDAIALAGALEQHTDLEDALNAYELERRPVIEVFQRAAAESQSYFETTRRYLGLEPVPFAFQLLTRSGRITYDDLRFRDVRFGELVDRWFSQQPRAVFTPPPVFMPYHLRGLTLVNRIAFSLDSQNGEMYDASPNGIPGDSYRQQAIHFAQRNVGLLLTGPVAISAGGRITPDSLGLYDREQLAVWGYLVEQVHARSGAKIALCLNHAGRRGATRPRSEGVDRPLREGGWPLLAPSALAYSSSSQLPRAMEREDMQRVREEFVHATQFARDAGFDMLQLSMAHGYLLASFLSPLTNQRDDDYGGSLNNRLRFPLEIAQAVRAIWPVDKPLSVALTASDCVKGGLTTDEAVEIARILKDDGCDIIQVQIGQTTPESEPPYGRGFLTSYSEQLRNEAGIPTIVGGYLTTSNEINTILAAGRADICIVDSQS
ncbi:MAG TPA: FAD-dependent monooxygenase [Ktedonobacteraceae bacterium]|nr:FAD-dependent monooxygenase [Ktedonobacteraceae bacterium]